MGLNEERRRLTIRVEPWQAPDNPAYSNFQPENVLPWTEPCWMHTTIEDLYERIIASFARQHSAKGKLRIKCIKDGYKNTVEPHYTVGDFFEDRANPAATEKDYTVYVFREPPLLSELENLPDRFASIAPESSARPPKRLRDGLTDHIVPRLYGLRGPSGTESSPNKYRRVEGGGRWRVNGEQLAETVEEAIEVPSNGNPDDETNGLRNGAREAGLQGSTSMAEPTIFDPRIVPQSITTGRANGDQTLNGWVTPKTESPEHEVQIYSVPPLNTGSVALAQTPSLQPDQRNESDRAEVGAAVINSRGAEPAPLARNKPMSADSSSRQPSGSHTVPATRRGPAAKITPDPQKKRKDGGRTSTAQALSNSSRGNAIPAIRKRSLATLSSEIEDSQILNQSKKSRIKKGDKAVQRRKENPKNVGKGMLDVGIDAAYHVAKSLSPATWTEKDQVRTQKDAAITSAEPRGGETSDGDRQKAKGLQKERKTIATGGGRNDVIEDPELPPNRMSRHRINEEEDEEGQSQYSEHRPIENGHQDTEQPFPRPQGLQKLKEEKYDMPLDLGVLPPYLAAFGEHMNKLKFSVGQSPAPFEKLDEKGRNDKMLPTPDNTGDNVERGSSDAKKAGSRRRQASRTEQEGTGTKQQRKKKTTETEKQVANFSATANEAVSSKGHNGEIESSSKRVAPPKKSPKDVPQPTKSAQERSEEMSRRVQRDVDLAWRLTNSPPGILRRPQGKFSTSPIPGTPGRRALLHRSAASSRRTSSMTTSNNEDGRSDKQESQPKLSDQTIRKPKTDTRGSGEKFKSSERSKTATPVPIAQGRRVSMNQDRKQWLQSLRAGIGNGEASMALQNNRSVSVSHSGDQLLAKKSEPEKAVAKKSPPESSDETDSSSEERSYGPGKARSKTTSPESSDETDSSTDEDEDQMERKPSDIQDGSGKIATKTREVPVKKTSLMGLLGMADSDQEAKKAQRIGSFKTQEGLVTAKSPSGKQPSPSEKLVQAVSRKRSIESRPANVRELKRPRKAGSKEPQPSKSSSDSDPDSGSDIKNTAQPKDSVRSTEKTLPKDEKETRYKGVNHAEGLSKKRALSTTGSDSSSSELDSESEAEGISKGDEETQLKGQNRKAQGTVADFKNLEGRDDAAEADSRGARRDSNSFKSAKEGTSSESDDEETSPSRSGSKGFKSPVKASAQTTAMSTTIRTIRDKSSTESESESESDSESELPEGNKRSKIMHKNDSRAALKKSIDQKTSLGSLTQKSDSDTSLEGKAPPSSQQMFVAGQTMQPQTTSTQNNYSSPNAPTLTQHLAEVTKSPSDTKPATTPRPNLSAKYPTFSGLARAYSASSLAQKAEPNSRKLPGFKLPVDKYKVDPKDTVSKLARSVFDDGSDPDPDSESDSEDDDSHSDIPAEAKATEVKELTKTNPDSAKKERKSLFHFISSFNS